MESRARIPLLVVLVVVLVTGIVFSGCTNPDKEIEYQSPAVSELASTMVPDVSLDIYLYGKQENSTTIPVKINGTDSTVDIDSISVWGTSTEDDFALGMRLITTSSDLAKQVYKEIDDKEPDLWKALSGKSIYVVQGEGTAAATLIYAIEHNDFIDYDDTEGLQAASQLPYSDKMIMAAIGLVKPSASMLDFMVNSEGNEDTRSLLGSVFDLIDINTVSAACYSPQQIDVMSIASMIDSGVTIDEEVGIICVLQSDLPGIVVAPAVKQYLLTSEFEVLTVDEAEILFKTVNVNNHAECMMMVYINGNEVIAALSPNEEYARILIDSCY